MEYADGAARFLTGTPNVPALYAATAGYDLIEEVGVDRIRENSLRQTQLLIDLADEAGFEVRSPRSAERRGGTVTVHVPEFAAVHRELSEREILCDFRPDAGHPPRAALLQHRRRHPLRDRADRRDPRERGVRAAPRRRRAALRRARRDERQDPLPDRGRRRPGDPLLGSARCAAAEGGGRLEPRASEGVDAVGLRRAAGARRRRPRCCGCFGATSTSARTSSSGSSPPTRRGCSAARGLHTRVGDGAFEIGYWVRADAVRQGIATTVAGALTRVGIELGGADRIEILRRRRQRGELPRSRGGSATGRRASCGAACRPTTARRSATPSSSRCSPRTWPGRRRPAFGSRRSTAAAFRSPRRAAARRSISSR